GLGCVAYWLLTGEYVFEEKGATAMMLAHVQKQPSPPSMRSPHAVPASLDRAVMMCLAKKPEERPAAADVVARWLSEGLDSWTAEDAARWWSANLPEDGTPIAAAAADSNTYTI